MNCAECNNKECRSTDIDCAGIGDSALQEYNNNTEYFKTGKISSIVEKENYMKSSAVGQENIRDFTKEKEETLRHLPFQSVKTHR